MLGSYTLVTALAWQPHCRQPEVFGDAVHPMLPMHASHKYSTSTLPRWRSDMAVPLAQLQAPRPHNTYTYQPRSPVNHLANDTREDLPFSESGSMPDLRPIMEDVKPESPPVDDVKPYLHDHTGLDRLFTWDAFSFEDVAEKAAVLHHDKTTPLSKPDNIKRLFTLSLYQPIIYCDNSHAMLVDRRFIKQRYYANRIARIILKIAPDSCGVDLRFVNARIPERNLSLDMLDRHLANVQPHGDNTIGTVLRRDILTPFVYTKIASGTPLERPILIYTITDNEPSGEPPDTFRDAVVECRRRLVAARYAPTSVMFCISQLGEDVKAAAFLAGLREDAEIQDTLYCTEERLNEHFAELARDEARLGEWLLKLLAKGIIDRRYRDE